MTQESKKWWQSIKPSTLYICAFGWCLFWFLYHTNNFIKAHDFGIQIYTDEKGIEHRQGYPHPVSEKPDYYLYQTAYHAGSHQIGKVTRYKRGMYYTIKTPVMCIGKEEFREKH